MRADEDLAQRFEAHRAHLRSVAYRMLGSLSEAEDAVQEAWLRLSRSDSDSVENLRAWLTTVVTRVCLDVLRSRRSRAEQPLDAYVPDPIVTRDDGRNPEEEAVLADSVGLALLVVLETLNPPERVAFVLHDVFGVPFEEIASVLDRTTAATRQLASRARRRVQGSVAGAPETDFARQRAAVDAFVAASRSGDMEALLAILDPGVVLRSDGGKTRPGATGVAIGAAAVAQGAKSFAGLAAATKPVLVNGMPGVLVAPGGRPYAVGSFVVRDGRIAEIYFLADPERLARLDLPALDS
jgi:RNA polymerase sigma factor (sigma-70 family)